MAFMLIGLFSPTLPAGEIWDGGGSDSEWSTAANWNTTHGSNTPPPNDGTADIIMAGTTKLSNQVDVDWDINSLTFNNTAGAFSINGYSGVTLGIGAGGMSNNDTQLQTLLLPIGLNASQTWTAAAGPIILASGISSHLLLPRTLTLAGGFDITVAGSITNNMTLNKTGAGTLFLVGSDANTYVGSTNVTGGTLALNRTGGTDRAIPGNLVIGDGAGTDTVRLDGAEQITSAAGTLVTVNSSGVFNLNGFNETLANLTLNGGAVSGAGTLTVKGAISSGLSSTSASIAGGTLDLNGATKTISVADGAAADDLVISSVISNGGLTKDGTGQLVLGGTSSNTYAYTSGPTTVNAGTLVLSKSAGYAIPPHVHVVIGDDIGGAGADVVRTAAANQFYFRFDASLYRPIASDITVASSGLLDLNGHDQWINRLSLTGGSVTTAAGTLKVHDWIVTTAASSTATISGKLLMAEEAWTYPTRMIRVPDGPAEIDLDISASISAVGDFFKDDTGTLALTGSSPNTFTDKFGVSNGTVILNKSVPDGAISSWLEIGYFGGSTFHSGPSTVRLAHDEQIAGIVTINAGHTLDLAGYSESIAYAYVYGLLLTGGGTLTAQTFGLHSNTVDTGAGTVTVTGTLRYYNPLGATPATLAGSLSLGGATPSVNVDDNAAAIDLTISAAISNGGLTKIGEGTLLMSGPANTYTGSTVVNAGCLLLSKSSLDGAILSSLTIGDGIGSDVVRLLAPEQILATSGNVVSVNTGGMLDLNGFNETIQDLAMNGGEVTIGAGTLGIQGSITTSPANATVATLAGMLDLAGGIRSFIVNDSSAAVDLDISAVVSGGGLLKQGGGTLRLGGNNTFADGIDHEAGRIIIAHDNALGTGTLTLRGGTIQADSDGRNVSNAVVISGPSTISGANNLTFDSSLTGNATLFKNGEGTLYLASNENAYVGNILITGGAITLADTGELRFRITNSGVNNRISGIGTGIVNLDGIFRLDTSQLSDTQGAWNLVDVASLASVNFNPVSFNLAFLGGTAFIDVGAGIYSSGRWRFNTATGSLTLAPGPALPGDYNGNGTVDAADYVVWRKTDGSPANYNTWRMHFGESLGSGAGESASASAPTPEPTSSLMLMLGMLAIFCRRHAFARAED